MFRQKNRIGPCFIVGGATSVFLYSWAGNHSQIFGEIVLAVITVGVVIVGGTVTLIAVMVRRNKMQMIRPKVDIPQIKVIHYYEIRSSNDEQDAYPVVTGMVIKDATKAIEMPRPHD